MIMKLFSNYLIITTLIICGVSTTALSTDAPSRPNAKNSEATLSSEMFSLFMAVQSDLPSDKVKEYWNELNEFTALLDNKKSKYKNEQAFLRFFFYRVHRQYLRKYTDHTTLYDTFEKGKYNCVTGTALYAILLDAMGINYQIRETPYHVFLIAYSSDGADSVLLESTDPRGFITNTQDIAHAISLYQESRVEQEDDTPAYEYSFDIDERIDLQELAGLSYFNQAVDHYNQQELQKAIQYLRQATVLYPTKRMEAFHSLIFQTARKAYSAR